MATIGLLRRVPLVTLMTYTSTVQWSARGQVALANIPEEPFAVWYRLVRSVVVGLLELLEQTVKWV